ncbi:glycosyl hydrolase family 28 protein [Actinoallomurus vinaceus]|uniref:Glycosyl hydrolase family 28 protein n=1 Tax=Actinoallomurus vinaceus TaxID=1080074 RepID=A0ABP8UQQ6_9ACTN
MADELGRRRFLAIATLAAGSPVFFGGTASAAPGGAGARPGGPLPRRLPWPEANRIVARTRLPAFPPRRFPVTDHGAVGDGTTDNTAAFAAAIAACHAAGGGHVIVPPGTWLTGAIHLKSNVDLHLEDGSTLRFSGDVTKYPIVLTRYEGIECMNHSPMIYAHRQRNIALTGSGTLDADATGAWNTGSDRAYLETLVAQGVPARERVVPGSGHFMRSTFVEPYECDTVLIQGVRLRNSRFWQLHPTLCRNVTVDGVDTAATKSQTDGCDPESCDHVVIRNSTLGAYDDNIAIKSGRDDDGRRVNVPSQNIVVYDCHFSGPWGAITCGSEQTGGIRNVYAHNCTLETRYALYVKSNTLRGGFTHNVNLDRFTATNLKKSFVFATTTYNNQTGSYTPRFGGFTITNSTCDKAPVVFDMTGLSEAPIVGLTVRNSAFTGIDDPVDKLTNVTRIRFRHVTVNGVPATR